MPFTALSKKKDLMLGITKFQRHWYILREISLTKMFLYIWNTNLIVVMMTQEIAGSCGLFWINELLFEYQNDQKSQKCREFHYTNSIYLQGVITVETR